MLELLRHSETTVAFQAMRVDGGDVHWHEILPPTCIRIRIDANTADVTRFVIHELIHVVILPIIVGRFDDTLEEAVLLSLEEQLDRYVKKSPARRLLWEDEIKKKVDEGLDPVSIEQQVKR